MDRPQLIRRLRIAASVFFALIAVALCVLWVRSYWWSDSVRMRIAHLDFAVGYVGGRFGVEVYDWNLQDSQFRANFESDSVSRDELQTIDSLPQFVGFILDPNRAFLAPFWLPVLLAAIPATLGWSRLPKSFSLRTLLIATTLVAVMLGLAVWAVR